jgi:hypothetical protein
MPGAWLLGPRTAHDSDEHRAVLLSVRTADGPTATDEDPVDLAELARLAHTDGLDVVGSLPRPATTPTRPPTSAPARSRSSGSSPATPTPNWWSSTAP